MVVRDWGWWAGGKSKDECLAFIDVFQIGTQTRGHGMMIYDWSGDNLIVP